MNRFHVKGNLGLWAAKTRQPFPSTIQREFALTKWISLSLRVSEVLTYISLLPLMPNSNTAIDRSASSCTRSLARWFQRHKEKLWWLHSLYALGLGIGIMWLGTQKFAYLRVTVFHISFIWLSSLFLPRLLNHPRLSTRWAARVRLFVNYFNKNFYQQMLFFVLPIYYASATLFSRNILFVLLVGISAILSTLDIIYDRHLSVSRTLTALFFAFNLFALINVMLPVLWSVSNTWTTRVSAVVAAVGFLTLFHPLAESKRRRMALGTLTIILLIALVEWGRAFIPPAPLRLASAEFGTSFQPESLRVESTVTELTPRPTVRLYGLTAIKAPLGLNERVQHRWYQNGKLIWASPFYNMTGGREEGYRVWTACSFDNIAPGTELRLDLETEGGQLIGRAAIRVAKA
jgi:hypothetical protein